MDREEIRQLLERINNAWLKGPPEQIPAVLGECFDDRMVVKGPGFQALGSGGKDGCVQSYVDFVRQAAIKECTLSKPDIDVAGDTAVATYSWQMTYALNGEEYRESGVDLFVFAKSAGRWLAVWRAMLPNAGRDFGFESPQPADR